MHKYQKKNNNLIKNIIRYINSDVKFKSSFNHPNRIYKLNVLLKYIINILMSGSLKDKEQSSFSFNLASEKNAMHFFQRFII
jgi:hypothetical protein